MGTWQGTWAQRMHSVVTCGHGHPGGVPYPHRLEKVKFGVTLDEVCKPDIPGPLLVLILKLNKEAPSRKDVFRAPGHQGAMKKLIHFLQAGRLVNVDNYSVYTIASVLKKFLRKIPNGIFGREVESALFKIIEIEDEVEQQTKIHRLITSQPIYTQRLLILLFGTFRVIASNSEQVGTGMSSEAIGVSVAPSFFQSCVSDGKTARMEDVLRYKVATRIMKQIIDQFASFDLFGRDNYEYYARVTGRVLRVQDEWICSFRYPALPGESQSSWQKTWLQCQCDRWVLNQEESQSTPALLSATTSNVCNSSVSLGIIPEHTLLESCARLSVSLEGPSIFTNRSHSSSSHSSHSSQLQHNMTLDELRAVNRYAESTKSLSYLPQVHERQTARMRTRSEWFLGCGGSLNSEMNLSNIESTNTGDDTRVGLSASSESIYQTKSSRSRGNSIRHRPHRVSSRRNKENGSGSRRNRIQLAINDSVKNLGNTPKNTSGNSSGTNDDKILKVNFENNSPIMDRTQNKTHVVSFE
ncbi:unconventional myosin-IXa isoform X2 [Contarinia nasturtii]|uniref:unconventional myosin-IXa isoform X2 n=1 Tax=Contarinia nasturtii TaxID=265458 RepID=UPI0012D42EB1|nr:unconventional myosin-IXa isoform X2 [Contarinia nasturtii]